jgi:cellulose synthase/poly-beta-1,6-N-acetylglucosamine synthase-like glycosyltransferase
VLTLKTFIWSHQCNRNVLQSCVVSGQLAAASQCNIKNITILHSSRMQRLLLNQAQKNLMNKLKENGTLKAVHCEIFSSWFLALVRILKMIKMWFILLLLLLLLFIAIVLITILMPSCNLGNSLSMISANNSSSPLSLSSFFCLGSIPNHSVHFANTLSCLDVLFLMLRL